MSRIRFRVFIGEANIRGQLIINKPSQNQFRCWLTKFEGVLASVIWPVHLTAGHQQCHLTAASSRWEPAVSPDRCTSPLSSIDVTWLLHLPTRSSGEFLQLATCVVWALDLATWALLRLNAIAPNRCNSDYSSNPLCWSLLLLLIPFASFDYSLSQFHFNTYRMRKICKHAPKDLNMQCKHKIFTFYNMKSV